MVFGERKGERGDDAAKREKRDQTIFTGRSPLGCGDRGCEHGNTVLVLFCSSRVDFSRRRLIGESSPLRVQARTVSPTHAVRLVDDSSIQTDEAEWPYERTPHAGRTRRIPERAAQRTAHTPFGRTTAHSCPYLGASRTSL